MKEYIETFNKYVEEQWADAGVPEGKSLLELLYYCFCIQNDLDTEEIRKTLQGMNNILNNLSLADYDALYNMAFDLCEKYQHEAFRTGLLVGFHLNKELTM